MVSEGGKKKQTPQTLIVKMKVVVTQHAQLFASP